MEDDSLQPVVIVSADGMPEAVIDPNRLHAEALLYGMQLAASAGMAGEFDLITAERMAGKHPQYVAALTEAALRHVVDFTVAHLLRSLEKAGARPDPRTVLREQIAKATEAFGIDR